MPTLGAPLDFAKLEGRNFQAHQLGSAPSSPVKGQLYYNTGDNTLYWYDGTTWQSAKGGVGTPIGPAGGDLSGTYPNPQIASGVIVDGDVNAAAAIQESKLALATDAVAGTGSRRTLGTGAQQALGGTTPLSSIAAPTADLNLNSRKITSLATPTAATDGANKSYVDGVAQGLDAKASVRVASTGNVGLGAPGAAIDGVTLSVNDRILLKDQTNPAQNGIYTYVDAVSSPARAADQDTWAEVPGAYVWVEEGTVNKDTGWVSTADAGGTLNTTSMPWTQFAAAGAAIAGAGLTKSGNTFDVGAGVGIVVAADTVAVDFTAIPKWYSSATHGAGTTITIPQSTHGCRASRGLIVMTVVEATGAEVLADVVIAANGDVTITFAASQSANTIRTTVIG